jgi:EAL domain-containing protein (putative c-di-GMP-specific phosphodiesterase class I)
VPASAADAKGMAQSEDLSSLADTTAGEGRMRSLGERLHSIVEHFETEVTLGILTVDASAFAGVESSFNGDALSQAMLSLGNLVGNLIGDRLGIGDEVVCGETGRNELVVVLFRHSQEASFYTHELPELQRILTHGFSRRNARVGYPYLKKSPNLPVGAAAALRNPTVSAATQIRTALQEAREDAELNERIFARRRRHQLIELVLEGRVRSVYEPIVDVATRTVFAYEALARGPEGTELHSPLALFASASEEDLLFQLDCLCRRSGLDGARDFPGDAKLFLNVRPTTIHDPSFRAEAIRATLDRSGLTPSDVVFEISEQESIEDFDVFREVRDYYGKLGIQIAMDDFGSGYSSLEAVMELSPEFIKVDRTFVTGIDQDPARQELLRALQTVASKIGARIVGEGLDTLEELETLGRLGIPFGQGWLFGKPHPLRTDT